MITLIRKSRLSIGDLKKELKRMLNEASASPKVRQLALEITGSHDTHNSIGSIYTWVKDNVRYIPDPMGSEGEIELFISPIRMTNDYYQGKALGGDCDDIALMTASLSQSIGIPSKIILIDTAGEGIDHAVAELWSEKLATWVMCDPSSKFPPGWQEKYYQRIEV